MLKLKSKFLVAKNHLKTSFWLYVIEHLFDPKTDLTIHNSLISEYLEVICDEAINLVSFNQNFTESSNLLQLIKVTKYTAIHCKSIAKIMCKANMEFEKMEKSVIL